MAHRDNPISLGFKRFFRKNFNRSDLRSESASIEDLDGKFDIKEVTRVKWDTRLTFLLYAIGYTLGFGKLWRLPFKMYAYGRGTYLLIYIVNCICIGIPLLILEFGIGQFCGRGCTHSFSMVPLFIGIGWSMLLMSILITIYFSVTGAWAYFYILSTYLNEMPWNNCNNDFNSFSCISSYRMTGFPNETGVLSSHEYFEFFVARFKQFPSGATVSMAGLPSLPSLKLTFSLALVYIFPVVINIYGKRISGRILNLTVVYPFCVGILLLIRSLALDGALNGIMFFFTFPVDNLMSVFYEALEQLFFSLGIGVGVMISLSSYNNFHDNIIFDVFVLVAIDILSCLIFGVTIFSAIGYLSYKTNIPIETVIKSEWEIFFKVYLTMFANIYGENFWIIILMLMLICVCFNTQMCFLDTITTALFEFFPDFYKYPYAKFVSEIVISVLVFGVGAMMITPVGVFWIYILNYHIVQNVVSVLVLMEIIVVAWIYGFKNFAKDYKLMMKYTICNFWMFMITFLEPLLVVSHFIYDISFSRKINYYDRMYPWWTLIVSVSIHLLFLIPIIIGMLHIILMYRLFYPEMTIGQLLRETLKPAPEWGPYYKFDWLSSSRYRNKLETVLNNPMFRANIRENEDIDEIINEIM